MRRPIARSQAPSRALTDVELVRWGTAILFGAVLVGYQFVACISTILHAPGGSLSPAYRAFVVLLSLTLLGFSLVRGQWRSSRLLLLYLAIYTARLVFDFFYANLPNTDNALTFFVLTTLIPTLALSISPGLMDLRRIMLVCLYWGGATCLLLLYIQISGAFVSEADYEQTGGRLSLEILNPINISYTGIYASIAGYAALASGRLRPITRMVALAMMPIGMVVLFAGGSRGPLVAIAASFTVMAFVGRRTWLIILLGLLTLVMLAATQTDASVMIDRLTQAGSDQSSRERIFVMHTSFDLALQHPFFGFGYVDPETGSYPHNVVVESFLALGLGGAALMIILQLRMVRDSLLIARQTEYFLPLITITSVANVWMSGSIWGASMFFVAAAVTSSFRAALQARMRAMAGGRGRAPPRAGSFGRYPDVPQVPPRAPLGDAGPASDPRAT